MLRINQNSIFSEFLKIVKNTLAHVINNTHHLFVIVPKIATQSDSLASKWELCYIFVGRKNKSNKPKLNRNFAEINRISR